MQRLYEGSMMIFVVLAVGLVLRLPLLNGSFWLDEAAQAIESTQPLSHITRIVDDFQPPLMTMLVHSLLFFSHQEWWLRLGTALVPGVVTIWATYEIGKKMWSKEVGLMASLLLATSSFHIFYSQELRPYALPAMFAALSWLILLGILEQKKMSGRHFLFLLLLSVLGIYSSYMYFFVLATQLGYVFVFKSTLRKQTFLWAVGCALSFLPWLPTFLAQLHAGQLLQIQLPGWKNIVGFDQFKSAALIFTKFLFGVIHLDITIWLGIVAIALILGFGKVLFQLKPQVVKKSLPLILWLILPIFLAWVVSFFVPILQPKRVLFCLPVAYLLISALISSSKEKAFQYGLFGLLMSINLFSSASYYTNPKYQREDWRSLHQYITGKYPASESVALFSFPEPFAPWRWYDDGKYPTFSTGVLSMKSLRDPSVFKKLTNYRYILVFDYLRDLTDPENSILQALQKYGYVEVDRITPTTEIGFVRVYARKESVIGMHL